MVIPRGREGRCAGGKQMRLADGLAATVEVAKTWLSPEAMNSFRDDVPDAMIREALKSVREEPVRRRALPGEVVIWLVIGMSLLRDRCIRTLVAQLKLALGKTRTVSSSAIVQARNRLGENPVATLFAYTADEWALRSAEEDRWRGLCLFGVDGTSLRVADTEENETTFGRPSHAKGRGASGYPQVRLVGLMALRSHLLLAASFGPYKVGETTFAKKLWYLLPDRSLVALDRGFVDYALFHQIMTSGEQRHFLCRGKKNLRMTTASRLGRNDRIVRMAMPRQLRRKHPDLPEALMLRVITYQRRGFQPQTLLTSLLDASEFPRKEIVALYHERWEIELGYDEIKTHTLEREESLRSRSPERVRQEIWGLLIAYNLVRRQIERFAKKQGIAPLRVSFRTALLIIRNTCVGASYGVGSVRRLIESMENQLGLLILPPRRERSFPRTVKIKMSNYSRNRGRLANP